MLYFLEKGDSFLQNGRVFVLSESNSLFTFPFSSARSSNESADDDGARSFGARTGISPFVPTVNSPRELTANFGIVDRRTSSSHCLRRRRYHSTHPITPATPTTTTAEMIPICAPRGMSMKLSDFPVAPSVESVPVLSEP